MKRFAYPMLIFLWVLFLFPHASACLAQTSGLVQAVGTAFPSVSNNLIERLEKYQKQNGQYAASEGARRFEDIGLDPVFWEGRNFNGIVYDPKGETLEVRPAEEYTFFVNQTSGETRILSYNLRWSLIYNLKDKKWYFGQIMPEETVNIKTLRVKKDTPYNPSEY